MKIRSLFFSVLFLACMSNESNGPSQNIEKPVAKSIIYENQMKIEVQSQFSWKDLEQYAKLEAGTPQIAMSGFPPYDGTDKMRVTIPLKMVGENKITFQLPEQQILLFDLKNESKVLYSLHEIIPSPSSYELVDFDFDEAQNLYVLFHARDPENRGTGISTFAKINADGKLLWSKAQKVDLKQSKFKPTFRQVLIAAGKVFVVEVRKKTNVYSVSETTGNLALATELADAYEDIRVDPSGNFYYVSWEQATGLRYWNKYDLNQKKVVSKVGNKEIYQYLPFPLGADENGNAYCYFGRTLAKMDVNSEEVKLHEQTNLVIDAAGKEVFEYLIQDDNLVLTHFGNAPSKPIVIPGAKALAEKHGVGFWTLVRMDADKWIFRGFSKTQNRFIFLDYNSKQKAFAENSYNLEDQTRIYNVQPPSTWAFDQNANMYIGLSGPDHFSILKMRGW